MNAFKRLVLFVFGAAGVFSLAALGLTWAGPYQQEAAALMGNYYYYWAVMGALAITAFGVLVAFLRSLFAPRRRRDVIVSKVGGDQITLTTAAISSQASHAIERSGRFGAEKVRVTATGGSRVRVDVRVRPLHAVNVAQEGPQLHDSLAQELAALCGDRVKRLDLQFVEAESAEPAQDVVVERVDEPTAPHSALEHAAGDADAPVDPAVDVPAAAPEAPAAPEALEAVEESLPVAHDLDFRVLEEAE